MCELAAMVEGSAAAVISFYALHHLDSQGVRAALREWHRVMTTGGQLLIAAWEGEGAIDYGDVSDVVAFRYRETELSTWTLEVGFAITRSDVEPVDGMPMDAVILEATRR